MNNKMNGHFVTLERNGNLKQVDRYEMDTLREWVEYRDGKIWASGYGLHLLMQGPYTEYDTLGRVTLIGMFEDGKLVSYKKYNHKGIVIEEGTGTFPPVWKGVDGVFINPFHLRPSKFDLIHGEKKYYDEEGKLIKSEQFINGKKLEE
jgi:antitoxin component YwqK of YwqJK toxin-antitoxin module